MRLGGATVLRGHVGFGHSTHIHTTKILRLSQDLPVIVEIVDSQEKIDAFLPVLDEMMKSGLVTGAADALPRNAVRTLRGMPPALRPR